MQYRRGCQLAQRSIRRDSRCAPCPVDLYGYSQSRRLDGDVAKNPDICEVDNHTNEVQERYKEAHGNQTTPYVDHVKVALICLDVLETLKHMRLEMQGLNVDRKEEVAYIVLNGLPMDQSLAIVYAKHLAGYLAYVPCPLEIW
jgi:hypothetical protein